MTAALAAPVAETPSTQPAEAQDGRTQQFISFAIGDEGYAIDIMAVREIKGWTETTPLPNQADYIRGVMNLRGIIVPVYDLRCRFGMGRTEASRTHAVIIVATRERMAGLLVDAVSDILTVRTGEICPMPEVEASQSASFLTGVIPVNGAMVVTLSLDELLPHANTESSNEVLRAA